MSASKAGSRKTKRAAIDWAEVRARLDTAQAAGEQAWTPGAHETKRILRERALALAAEPGRTQTLDQSIEVVEFLLAHERYAVESSYVRSGLSDKHLAKPSDRISAPHRSLRSGTAGCTPRRFCRP